MGNWVKKPECRVKHDNRRSRSTSPTQSPGIEVERYKATQRNHPEVSTRYFQLRYNPACLKDVLCLAFIHFFLDMNDSNPVCKENTTIKAQYSLCTFFTFFFIFLSHLWNDPKDTNRYISGIHCLTHGHSALFHIKLIQPLLTWSWTAWRVYCEPITESRGTKRETETGKHWGRSMGKSEGSEEWCKKDWQKWRQRDGGMEGGREVKDISGTLPQYCSACRVTLGFHSATLLWAAACGPLNPNMQSS